MVQCSSLHMSNRQGRRDEFRTSAARRFFTMLMLFTAAVYPAVDVSVTGRPVCRLCALTVSVFLRGCSDNIASIVERSRSCGLVPCTTIASFAASVVFRACHLDDFRVPERQVCPTATFLRGCRRCLSLRTVGERCSCSCGVS